MHYMGMKEWYENIQEKLKLIQIIGLDFDFDCGAQRPTYILSLDRHH